MDIETNPFLWIMLEKIQIRGTKVKVLTRTNYFLPQICLIINLHVFRLVNGSHVHT